MASSAERRPRVAHAPLELTDSGTRIESLPWLGTTWYRRGPAYWLRRAAMSLFALALAAADVAFLGLIIAPMLESSYDRPLGIFLLAAVVIVGAGMMVWLLRRSRGMQRQASKRQLAAAGAAGGAMGPLLVAGTGLGALLFFLAVVATAGPLILFFVLSLSPELSAERVARERLALG